MKHIILITIAFLLLQCSSGTPNQPEVDQQLARIAAQAKINRLIYGPTYFSQEDKTISLVVEYQDGSTHQESGSNIKIENARYVKKVNLSNIDQKKFNVHYFEAYDTDEVSHYRVIRLDSISESEFEWLVHLASEVVEAYITVCDKKIRACTKGSAISTVSLL